MTTTTATAETLAEATTPAAWLQHANLELTAAARERFTEMWEDIASRYTDRGTREAARIGAAYYLAGLMSTTSIADELAAARARADEMLATARAVAILSVGDGKPEAVVAREIGVDRMALRNWRGKR